MYNLDAFGALSTDGVLIHDVILLLSVERRVCNPGLWYFDFVLAFRIEGYEVQDTVRIIRS